ncbi:MAG: diguanylate cyclase [Pseudomonadota bacterium]
MSPSRFLPGTSRGRLPRQIYLPRAAGLGLGAVGMAVALWEVSRPVWVWAFVAFAALVWPHLAYQRSLRSANPNRAETQNMLLDAALIGFTACAAGGNLVPSAIALTVAGMNSMAVNGWRLLVASMLAAAAGIGAALLALPVVFAPMSSLAVQLACLPLMVVYFPVFGWTMLQLAHNLHRSREAVRQASQLDGLSGLLNRRSFEDCFAAACDGLQAAHPLPATTALLLFDVDHFKRINDTAGHATGDAVIRHMGEVLQASVRPQDTAARYGGDEFVVLLQGAGVEDARVFVDRVKATLQQRQRPGDGLAAFTLSTGIACYDAGAPTPQSWMARADAALYTVKRRARGGVEISC